MASSRTVEVRILGDASSANRAIRSIQGPSSKMGNTLRSVGRLAVLGGAAAVGAIGAVGYAAVQAARESEKVAAQTEAVIKSTKGAANVSVGEIGKMASKLSLMAGVADETIQSGSNLLLTFTNIRNEAGKTNDIFDQATKTALDMSVALDQDMKSSAMQLGKALNDPIKGLTALSRVGVAFTDQQKKQITTMTESGNILGAQKIILGELKKEFGGSAKAVADPFDRAKVAVDELMEGIGKTLLPIVSDLATELADFIGSKGFKQWLTETTADVKTFAKGIGTVVGVVKTVFNTITGLFEGGGKSKGGGLFDGILKSAQKVTSALAPLFRSAFTAVKTIISVVVTIATEMWKRFGVHIVQFAKSSLQNMLQVVRGVMDVLKGIFDLITAVLTGKWGKAWNALKMIVRGAWNIIVGLVRQAANVLSTVLGALIAAISAIFRTGWNALATVVSAAWRNIVSAVRTGVGNVISFVSGLPDKITGAIGDLGGLLYDAGASVIQGLINGIQDKINDLAGLLSDVTDKIPDWKGPRPKDLRLLRPAGQAVMKGFQDGLNDGFKKIKPDLRVKTGSMTGRATVAPMARRAAMSGGGGGSVVNVHFHGPVAQDAEKWVVKSLNNAVKKKRAG